MIYIIPVSHQVQGNDPSDYPWARDFQKYLKYVATKFNVTLIAEEWSDSLTTQKGTNDSNVKEIANELGIDYKMIDPNVKLRSEMGIPMPVEIKRKLFPEYKPTHPVLTREQQLLYEQAESEYFPKRESYWLAQIQGRLDEDIILICGSNHVSIDNKHSRGVTAFDEKLRSKGHDVEILSEDFFLSTGDI